ncbi:MAG: hypothetical protein HRF47_14060 [Chloroflexota bacterium]|jgi:hypothetical protein
MFSLNEPSLGFVVIFLLFSVLFFFNTYRLWFKTDEYYQSLYDSLIREPSIYPFRDFFLKRLKNKQKWVLWQKIFSLFGVAAVLAVDVLVVMTFVSGK